MTRTDTAVVLLVEDEPDVAETYRRWLSGRYEIRHAASGREALDVFSADVDVVLLDRMMHGMSGEEVLAKIRARDGDCRVAMVTAVDPDFDIIEMGFDEYLQKPPTRDQLVDTIERLLERREYTTQLREYYSLLAKRGALQSEKRESELATSEAYERLQRQITEIKSSLSASEDRLLDDAAFIGVIRTIDGGDTGASDD